MLYSNSSMYNSRIVHHNITLSGEKRRNINALKLTKKAYNYKMRFIQLGGLKLMKIRLLKLRDFMLFEDLSIELSPNINVICGSNSVGKTVVLKAIYSLLASYRAVDSKTDSKEKNEMRFVEKLVHVFRPEDMTLGRLARRKQGMSRAECSIEFDDASTIQLAFGSKAENHMDLTLPEKEIKPNPNETAIYFPPKEIISSTENFRSLYEDMHIAFEETYYDLARLLDRPLKKGRNSAEQNKVLESLGNIMEGSIVQRDNKFYLNIAGKGEFEMGLVSEGYRKLATIVYLILNGSLNSNSVLFWDEPETNMNPKMIRPLVEAIMQLAKLGVQVFITTHDYFLQQYLNMYMAYPEINSDHMDIKFISLYRTEDNSIQYEVASDISELQHNAIMEEFDAIYDREQGIMYDRIRK